MRSNHHVSQGRRADRISDSRAKFAHDPGLSTERSRGTFSLPALLLPAFNVPSDKSKRVVATTSKPIDSFLAALEAAEPRPEASADRGPKKNYAERFSNTLAVLIANRLRATGQFDGILPDFDGTGRESQSASGRNKKAKKTDVNYSTKSSGLELLVSIKTLSFKDAKRKRSKEVETVTYERYTKNMVRNDHELRAEAMDHHERHPFAVLVGALFLPVDSCDDGANDKSSFAHAVMTFRNRAGREKPSEPPQFFERFYLALYEWEGNKRGNVGFFDITSSPPKRGRPKTLLALEEVIAEIVKVYGLRNRRYIEWADEDQTSATIPTLEAAPTEGDDEDA